MTTYPGLVYCLPITVTALFETIFNILKSEPDLSILKWASPVCETSLVSRINIVCNNGDFWDGKELCTPMKN